MNYDCLKLYEVTNLLLSCRPKKPVDAVLLHTRSFGGDDDGLFELVAELVPSVAKVVVINGGSGMSKNDPSKKAWPGAEEYRRRLSEFGIMNVVCSAPALHTQEESEKFTDVLAERKWKRVIVANLPHYLLRTMLSAVCEIQKRFLPVALYPAAPTSLSWRKAVSGSQGSPPIERLAQCPGELKRSEDYPREYPGQFVTVSELITYLSGLNE